MRVDIKAPLTKEEAAKLRAGDIVSLTGYIYTGRDAAHKRMVEGFEKTGKFPFDIKDQIIYYVGPSPAKPGNPVGSAGPTTSGRMDAYAPVLLDNGSTGMIGKGGIFRRYGRSGRPHSKAHKKRRGNRLCGSGYGGDTQVLCGRYAACCYYRQ